MLCAAYEMERLFSLVYVGLLDFFEQAIYLCVLSADYQLKVESTEGKNIRGWKPDIAQMKHSCAFLLQNGQKSSSYCGVLLDVLRINFQL